MTDVNAVAAQREAAQAARVQQDNDRRATEAARSADADEESRRVAPPRDSGRGQNVDTDA